MRLIRFLRRGFIHACIRMNLRYDNQMKKTKEKKSQDIQNLELLLEFEKRINFEKTDKDTLSKNGDRPLEIARQSFTTYEESLSYL